MPFVQPGTLRTPSSFWGFDPASRALVSLAAGSLFRVAGLVEMAVQRMGGAHVS